MATLVRRKPRQRPLRVLTSSAVRLDLKNKTEARQQRALLQGWQADAWNYRDSIPELRYAVQFKANAMSRMRLFVGVEPEVGESDKPVPLDEASGIPEAVASIASQALMDLAVDEGQRRVLLKNLSTSLDVAGECRILGRTDPETGEEDWSVRSTDEIEFRDDGYYMREIPDGPQGIIPWVKLDPELDAISRIWVPHPRFSLMADSPLKAMLQSCEALLILRRMIRAEGRSRLNRGILAVPDELSIKIPEDDNEDPEADPFFSGLVRALTEPISDEGSASAYAPIVVRGPAEILKALQRISLTEPFEEQAMKAREELVGNMATGFDLPKEVVTGVVDLNHWSAWNVDDNTFRHHLEPHTIQCCDALTGGYFRPRLLAQNIPIQYARRLVIWYDPTELVTHPDQTKDAMELYDRHAISSEALLRVAGFADMDAPKPEEIILRMLQNMKAPPANLVMAAVHQLFPTLTIPPIETAGTIPGVKPSGVDPGEPAVEPEEPVLGQPQLPVSVDDAPPAPEPAEHGEPEAPAITASAHTSHRLSRKLSQIDRDLRGRLQTAANAAMMVQLEKLGARLRTKVAKDETLRTKIAHRRNERVSAILGKDTVTAAGLGDGLPDEGWTTFRTQFFEWTEAAQTQALQTAMRLGAMSDEDEAVKLAEAAQILGREKSWEWLSQALTNLGEHLMFNPDPNVSASDWGDLNPDTIVPTGLIRGALGIAGGSSPSDATTTLSEPVGSIGTGSTISDLLEAGGMETDSYTWEHGSMTIHPFEPHAALDGVEFSTFDSEALANTEGWPDNQYFMPGDHAGCGCDVCPNWVEAAQPEESELAQEAS